MSITAVSAFSQVTVTGEAPITNNSAINTALGTAFGPGGSIISDLQNQLGGLNIVPNNLIQGFGNASVYSSHGATQRNFGGYKSLALTFGSSVGIQLPLSPSELYDIAEGGGDVFDGLFSDGDLKLGVVPQMLNAQIGFNSLLFKNLYLGVRIGYTPDFAKMARESQNRMKDLSAEQNIGDVDFGLDGLGFLDNFSYSNFTLGVTANLQLVKGFSLGGLFAWRGINLGSGFIYQHTQMNIAYPLDAIREDLGTNGGGGMGNAILTMNPNIFFEMDIKTYTIPVELMTAVKFLFVNIPIGIGADFAFGTSTMNIGMRSDMTVTYSANGFEIPTTPGSLNIEAGGKAEPNFSNLKIMSGIGLSLGPVLIDIPVTYYFKDNGIHVGFTFGLTF